MSSKAAYEKIFVLIMKRNLRIWQIVSKLKLW